MKKKQGFALMSKEKRIAAASKGGKAKHAIRGLQGASPETRHRVAVLGGKA